MPLENLLFKAIIENNLLEVNKLLNNGGNINISNVIKEIPLHISVMNPDITRLLIKNGADINSVNNIGDTPLHCAVDMAELETLCMLLYYGADPNVANIENMTPFMKALISGFEELQEALLEYVDDFADHENIVALSLKYNSPFAKEIILRGGKIDQKAVENFSFIDENLELFKFIWPRIYISEIDGYSFGTKLLYRLSQECTQSFDKYLDFLIENSSVYTIQQLANGLSYARELHDFISSCYHFGCLDQLTKFICLLLQYDFECSTKVYIQIFEFFGYCELFKILLHFCHEETIFHCEFLLNHSDLTCLSILPIYLCFIKIDKKIICDSKLVTRHQIICPKTLYNLMGYWANSSLFFMLTKQISNDPKLSDISLNIPMFPSLVELARDKTRKYIVNKFRMSKCSQYYTYIHHLCIPTDCKKILSFERKIYNIDI